jgi:hypothetical protein
MSLLPLEAQSSYRSLAMRRFPPLAVTLCAALGLAACSFSLGAMNPSPNVLLLKSTKAIALRFSPEVPESFSLHRDDSGPSIDVSEWHESLGHAFKNGFAPFFVSASGNGPSDLTLVIVHAEPAMVSTPDGGREMALRYQAELIDAHDQEIKAWADTVHRPVVVGSGFANADVYKESVSNAVAGMFEKIAKDLPQP